MCYLLYICTDINQKTEFFCLQKRVENSILLSYKASTDRCNDDTLTVMAKYHIVGLSVLLACVGYVLSCTCPVPRPTNGCQADFCKLNFPWTTVYMYIAVFDGDIILGYFGDFWKLTKIKNTKFKHFLSTFYWQRCSILEINYFFILWFFF